MILIKTSFPYLEGDLLPGDVWYCRGVASKMEALTHGFICACNISKGSISL